MDNEIHPLVDWHLRNWARWMRHPGLDLGYPKKSSGLESGYVSGSDGFDILCEEADEVSAVTLNAIIDGLPQDESSAISHKYLHAVYRVRDYNGSLLRAISKIWRGMLSRGIA